MNVMNRMNQLQNRNPSILGYDDLRKSAILLPLVYADGEVHILFEVRSLDLHTQPGDICFPGGRIDVTDKTPKHCAIRETMEELGVQANDITSLVPLDYIVSDFGRLIYPFAGIITNPDHIQPNPSEVGSVFTVPLQHFIHTKPKQYKVDMQVVPEEDFPFELIVGGKNYNWQTRYIHELFYQYQDKVIWGLTAKILQHFLQALQDKEKKGI